MPDRNIMEDFIIIAVVLIIISLAVLYIVKEKKRGVKCIGCPSAGECARRNGGACACNNEDKLSCGCHTDVKK